jgi:WD40 repeat protein
MRRFLYDELRTSGCHSLHSYGYKSMILQVISCDAKGFVKYWDAETYSFPAASVTFTSMFATNLMDCVKSGIVPRDVAVSKDGRLLALTCSDLSVLVLDYRSGKLRQRFEVSMQVR